MCFYLNILSRYRSLSYIVPLTAKWISLRVRYQYASQHNIVHDATTHKQATALPAAPTTSRADLQVEEGRSNKNAFSCSLSGGEGST